MYVNVYSHVDMSNVHVHALVSVSARARSRDGSACLPDMTRYELADGLLCVEL